MIKVIASDMDGTLLGLDHKVAPRTLEAIHMAQEQGIRFMIATGRNFRSAMEELEELDLECDYLVGSGAEVRNPQREVVHIIVATPGRLIDLMERKLKVMVKIFGRKTPLELGFTDVEKE